MTPKIYIGDDGGLSCHLRRQDSAGRWISYAIPAGSTVRYAIMSSDRATLLAPNSGSYTASNAAAGADWDNGIVAVTFPSEDTGTLTAGSALVELEVTEPGGQQFTFQEAVRIEAAIISS